MPPTRAHASSRAGGASADVLRPAPTITATQQVTDGHWLTRPIGNTDRPATVDRFMDLKRFLVACVYRGAYSPPLPFGLFGLHAGALYAALHPPSSAAILGACCVTYSVQMFGITGGYHRYFSHRSYKTSRPFQFVLAVAGSLAWQRGPLWWSGGHGHHHLHSDTELDAHSPVTGSFLWSHMGWYWASAEHEPVLDKFTRTWRKYPELVWLDRLHVLPGLMALGGLWTMGGGEMALWGFVVPTVASYHATFSVNSICHVSGSRRFETSDYSTNNWWVALLTFGEGWHNNHHMFRWSAKQGLYWYEPDATFCVLRALEKVGIVWDIKVPTAKQIAQAPRSKSAVD